MASLFRRPQTNSPLQGIFALYTNAIYARVHSHAYSLTTFTDSVTIGQLTDHEHGLHIAAIEAGTGHVTRQTPGTTTRFIFKKPFKKAPHVQLTLCNPAGNHVATEIYLLNDNGPAVDADGFSVGIFSQPGHTAEFRYLAMTILESSKPSTSEGDTTEPKKSDTTKPKTANPKSKP
ncbi:hypothetical protein BJY04DRAFT_221343 [Aspergillus karnatakaensis]|uniref:uncharacterized protein n=1 Tax=Aspergillus karnatakaensis TaxID=1810916 RepID=UPI003CCD17D7